MDVKRIAISGNNTLISTVEFDCLAAQASKVDVMEKLVEVAIGVAMWDWDSYLCDDTPERMKRDLEALKSAFNGVKPLL